MLNDFIIGGRVWYFDPQDKVLHVKINIGTTLEFIIPIPTADIIYPNNFEKNEFVIVKGHGEKIIIDSNGLEDE